MQFDNVFANCQTQAEAIGLANQACIEALAKEFKVAPSKITLTRGARSKHKVFTIRERLRLQYRAEFFNVLNHTQLNNPDTAFTDSTFGRITGARDPRIIQMALKLIF